jgi:hypothetical protein
VSYWKLTSGGGTDSNTTNANDLTFGGGNGPASATGVIGTCGDFDASNSERLFITDANQTNLDITGNLSLVFWIKPGTLSGTQSVIGKWNDGINQKSYHVRLSGGNFIFYISSNGAAIQTVTATQPPTGWQTDVWYCVQCFYDDDNGVMGIRFNDLDWAYASASGGIFNSTAQFELASRNQGFQHYDGYMDEVGIWDVVLTPYEFDFLFNWQYAKTYEDITPGITNSVTGDKVVALWEMNDPANGVRKDYLGVENLSDLNTVGRNVSRIGYGADFELSNGNEGLEKTSCSAASITSSFFVGCWVKPESGTSDKQIMFTGDGVGDNAISFYIDSTEAVGLSLRDSADATWQNVETSASAVTVGKHHFVYCYYDASAQVIGVGVDDGAATTASATGGINAVSSPTLRFGIDINDFSEFDGVIGDAILMHEVPTAEEITYFWNYGIGRRAQEIMLHGPAFETDGLGMNALDGLAMLYTLDEEKGDRRDWTMRGNMIEDNNSVSFGSGVMGSAASFNGSSNYLNNTEPPNDILFQDLSGGSTDWTMAIWANPAALTSDAGLFGNYGGVGNGGVLIEYDQSQDRYRIRADDGTGTWSVDADNFGSVSTGTFNFIVAQYDASEKTLFISVDNGTKDSGLHTNNLTDGTGDLEVGVNSPGLNYWNGSLDQPMVWWRMISDSEIAWHYNSGSGRSLEEMLTAENGGTPPGGGDGNDTIDEFGIRRVGGLYRRVV